MIDPRIIEDIKNRNNIEDIVSSYVTLKRAGANLQGLCPFHSEKTPSFTIFTATQSYYCFGCGAGGDVINFIRNVENLDYRSAVEFLAQRAGITLPEQSGGTKSRIAERNRLLAMNKAAAIYFRDKLFDDRVGAQALGYLKKRGLPPLIIKRFGLGYSPPDFSGLTNHLRTLGFTEEEMITGFLCGRSKKTGGLYDYFRNRIIFPIIDVSGNVIAFGGRVMDNSMPKYLNTSDTPVFHKSRNLFALNFAKNNCAQELILCEGYMDVIALHAAGFENAVATLGTAITPEQARIMSRYTKKVIIAYDGDDAGKRAAAKATNLLSAVDLDVRILRLNDAKDPDDYIKTFGAARFGALLKESRSSFEYNFEEIRSKYDIELPDQRVKACAEISAVIARVYSEAERDVYISEVSKALNIPFESIKNDVNRIISAKIREYKKDEKRKVVRRTAGFGDFVNRDYVKNVKAARAEEVILGLMLAFQEHREAVLSGKTGLVADDFATQFGRRVFEAIGEYSSHDEFNISLLGERFTPEEFGRIIRIQNDRLALMENGPQVLAESIEVLKTQKLKARENAEGGDIESIATILKLKKQKIDSSVSETK
ncbi:MAG: DNA primase [Clostridiales bacterium]|nr:DNA primase [Clostridiales bacterium]